MSIEITNVNEPVFLTTATTKLAYRIYEQSDLTQSTVANSVNDNKTIVLIHGAGVGGELTWTDFLPHLTQWQRIIVPDLKGMGSSYGIHHDTVSNDESATSIDELANDIVHLLEHLAIKDFDLVGYSLGGLVSLALNEKLITKNIKAQKITAKVKKMALLEPAGLDREKLQDLIELRRRYKKAASIIRDTKDVELGIMHFVDSVAPNRRKHPVAEETTQSRLAHRPLGFAYALDAVTDFAESHQEQPNMRENLLTAAPATLLLSGDLSHELLQDYHALLAQKNPAWQHDIVKGTDHSLPFQKPRQIAKLLDKWFSV